jgi:hypothetical protein
VTSEVVTVAPYSPAAAATATNNDPLFIALTAYTDI